MTSCTRRALLPGRCGWPSPFNDCAQESLKLYKVIDPSNWARMIGRVNGVNFTGLYGGTTAMGWKTHQAAARPYLEIVL